MNKMETFQYSAQGPTNYFAHVGFKVSDSTARISKLQHRNSPSNLETHACTLLTIYKSLTLMIAQCRKGFFLPDLINVLFVPFSFWICYMPNATVPGIIFFLTEVNKFCCQAPHLPGIPRWKQREFHARCTLRGTCVLTVKLVKSFDGLHKISHLRF